MWGPYRKVIKSLASKSDQQQFLPIYHNNKTFEQKADMQKEIVNGEMFLELTPNS